MQLIALRHIETQQYTNGLVYVYMSWRFEDWFIAASEEKKREELRWLLALHDGRMMTSDLQLADVTSETIAWQLGALLPELELVKVTLSVANHIDPVV